MTNLPKNINFYDSIYKISKYIKSKQLLFKRFTWSLKSSLSLGIFLETEGDVLENLSMLHLVERDLVNEPEPPFYLFLFFSLKLLEE